MKYTIKKVFTFIVTILVPLSSVALTIESKVYSTDNLYAEDWGHWYTTEADHSLYQYSPGSTYAKAVMHNGSAFDFSNADTITVTIAGMVEDAGGYETSAAGCQIPECQFKDNYFHDQMAYGVIGIWSSTSDYITRINNNFFKNDIIAVGEYLELLTPDVTSELYLFLGENDGNFNDNSADDFYSARIEVSQVPLPAAAWLFSSALIITTLTGFRKKIKSIFYIET